MNTKRAKVCSPVSLSKRKLGRVTEAELYDGVIVNGTSDFAFVVECLRRHEAGWCVIGGLAVNVYTAPIYTADLDLVAAAAEREPVLADLRAADFRIKEFEFSINAKRRAGPGGRTDSLLMVQFTKVERYQAFIPRASLRTLFGLDVPVAALADVVQGKLWAWSDPTRRPTKQLKDKLDLLRLAEAYPAEVEPLLPEPLQTEAVANRLKRPNQEDGWGDED